MRPAIALLLAGLALASATTAPAQALTLLDETDDEAGTQLRVRTQGSPLAVGAPEGDLRLEGEPLASEPEPIQAPGTDWRGYENVTTLALEGTGLLLIVENRTGLLLSIDTSTERAGSSNTTTNANTTANDTSPRERSPPAANASTAAPPTAPPTGSPSSQAATTPPAGHEGDQGDEASLEQANAEESGLPIPRDPVAVLSALVAVGAFLVERWTRSAGEEDAEEGLEPPS